jgi:cytochrome c oxidase cbb3-type subunit 3
MKRVALILSGWMLTMPVLGQEASAAQSGFRDDPFGHPMFPYYFVLALIFVSLILVAIVGVYLIRIVNLMTEQIKKEKAATQGAAYIPEPSWWNRFTQKMNASVPVEREKDIEMDHSYDGIKELDNHLPPWWKWLFYGTIAWAALYIVVFHLSDTLPLSLDEYRLEIAQAEEQSRKLKAAQPENEFDEDNLRYTADAALIEKGRVVFNNNPCGSCHRSDGGGNTIGPNLTDPYWIHGGDIKNIFSTIKNGAVDKGMPAWEKAMSAQDLRDVTYYIISLQGSNPPDAKAPQGELVRHDNVSPSDSTGAQAAL